MANFNRARNVSGFTRVRGWILTLNNYSEDDIVNCHVVGQRITETSSVRYFCWSQEVAPTTGTPHLQGFLYLKNPCGLANVLKIMGKGWDCTPVTRDSDAAVDYPKKGDNFEEYGTKPKFAKNLVACEKAKEAKASKADSFLEAIEKGASDNELRQQFPALFLQQFSKLGSLRSSLCPPKPTGNIIFVMWLHGPAGTGKSRVARYIMKNSGLHWFDKPVSDGWWCGIESKTEGLLIDDFDESCVFKANMKNICDVYGGRMQTKGGSTRVNLKLIIITSNRTIEEIYSAHHSLEPMKRRVCEIKWPLEGCENWGRRNWEPSEDDCRHTLAGIFTQMKAFHQSQLTPDDQIVKLADDLNFLAPPIPSHDPDLHCDEEMDDSLTDISQCAQPLSPVDVSSDEDEEIFLPPSRKNEVSEDEGKSLEEMKRLQLSDIRKRKRPIPSPVRLDRPRPMRPTFKRRRFTPEEIKVIRSHFVQDAASCSEDEDEEDSDVVLLEAVRDYEERLQQEMEDIHDIEKDQRD